MEISRRGFLHDALGTAVTISGLAATQPAQAAVSGGSEVDFYLQLVRANEAVTLGLLANPQAGRHFSGPRGAGEALDSLAAAYSAPESAYHHSAQVLVAMTERAKQLLRAQNPDGTIDAGNLCSPPDTSFVVQTVAMALSVLRRENRSELAELNSTLEKFLLATGDALVTGGIHTPNHRWVLSSALAQLHTLFPSPKYAKRIDDWLGEGIYCDADGQFAERSVGIYSRVIDNALITMARHLQRPELLEPVRRNLSMTLAFMHPDGELETVASRRQDQTMQAWISNYYLQYRYMAILDHNPEFAAVARFAEELGLQRAEDDTPLLQFLEEPLYRRALPEPQALPTSYARHFAHSSLVRIRRGVVSATLYGGSDWPLGTQSGLASNASFFNFRKGAAVLDAVRLMPQFFSEGAFRSAGMKVEGNQYQLQETTSVPYYQPLPQALRNPQGDYALSPAGNRFWSKMNFAARPVSNLQTLEQRISIREEQGVFELSIAVDGHDQVPVVLELAFRKGGVLEGVVPGKRRTDLGFLAKAEGSYRVGEDVIRFGPGEAAHEQVRMEAASGDAHYGATRPECHKVYITGFTPFRKTITIA